MMEYVTGRSLEERIAADGKMEPLDVFRMFLPVVECLGRLHENGIIHRDISPDNILCQEDGSLKLVDFGAAREFCDQEARGLTGISKNNYSPAEQIDKNGKQGPWTDVYSLCATMYYCMTTVPPEDSVQRLFLDDLKPPSKLGIEIDGSCESIVMKGLSMEAEKRYPSMTELAEAILAVLPEETVPAKIRKPLVIILTASLCAIAFLVLWIVLHKKEADPFKGVETEQFLLTASNQLSVSEFISSQEQIAAELAPAIRQGLNSFALENILPDVLQQLAQKKHLERLLVSLTAIGGQVLESPALQQALLEHIRILRESYERDSAGRAFVLASMGLSDEKILNLLVCVG